MSTSVRSRSRRRCSTISAPSRSIRRTRNGIGGEVSLTLNAANVNRDRGALSVGRAAAVRLELQPLQRLRPAAGQSLPSPGAYKPGTQLHCCAASPATISAPPRRRRGKANTSIRSAKSGSRSSTRSATARIDGPQHFRARTPTAPMSSRPTPTPSRITRSPPFSTATARRATAPAWSASALEYRYPFVYNSGWGQQTITPIAQLIVRPDAAAEPAAQRRRAEPGVRHQQPVLVEQIFRLRPRRGRHPAQLRRGIQRQPAERRPCQRDRPASRSSCSARTPIRSPTPPTRAWNRASTSNFPILSPARRSSPSRRRSISFRASRSTRPLSRLTASTASSAPTSAIGPTNIDYAQYAAQPDIGWPYPRQGMTAPTRIQAQAGHHADRRRVRRHVPALFRHRRREHAHASTPTGYNFGIAYETSCTTFKAIYDNYISDPLSTTVGQPPPVYHNQTFLFQVTLRTIGDVVRVSTGTSSVTNPY